MFWSASYQFVMCRSMRASSSHHGGQGAQKAWVPATATVFPSLIRRPDAERCAAALVFARKQNCAAYRRRKQRECKHGSPEDLAAGQKDVLESRWRAQTRWPMVSPVCWLNASDAVQSIVITTCQHFCIRCGFFMSGGLSCTMVIKNGDKITLCVRPATLRASKRQSLAPRGLYTIECDQR